MPEHMNVPPPHRAPLTMLARMDELDYKHLFEALVNTQAAISLRAYADRVAAKLPEKDNDQTKEIIRALIPLFWLIDDTTPKDRLASDLGKALVREDPNFTEDDSKSLVVRIGSILEIEATLGTTAKAALVYTDHDHSYCKSNVLTDIRPIFMTDATKLPVAVTLVHTLKIQFHHSDEKSHGEFFVALDTADLIELEKVVVRAKQKADSIVAMMESTHIPLLSTSKD